MFPFNTSSFNIGCFLYLPVWVCLCTTVYANNGVFLCLHDQSRASHGMSSSNKIDVSFLKEPGVYEILDVQNNLSYYGETDCLLNRFQIHWRQLRNGTHPCRKLLEAFQKQNNEDGFQFFVLVSGPDCITANKRKEYQDLVIEENSFRCYNQTKQQRLYYPSTTIRAILYKGRRYDSVRGALRDTEHVKISRTTLKRHLADPTIQDVYYLEEEKEHGSLPLFARKGKSPLVFFPSIRAALRAGFAKNRNIASQKLKQNIDGWCYAAVDEQGKPLRHYQLKDSDLTYEMYLEKFEP